jgi:sorting nexin-8
MLCFHLVKVLVKLKCDYILILFWLIELPRPELGDLSDLAPERTTSPTQLGLRYPDICQFDTIEVDLVPEKKGLFLKHVEYQVSSKVMYNVADLCVFQCNKW